MYDGLQVQVMNPKVLGRLRHMVGLVGHFSEETGEVLSHSRCYDCDAFKIFLREGDKPMGTIRGSLHKYWAHGENDTLFTFRQVRKAVERFAWSFNIDLRMPCLQRIEFGVNIHAKSPETIIDAAVLYHGQGPTKVQRKKKNYYKFWEFSDYTIKLYRKGDSLVRFEVHVKRLRWLKDVCIRSLEDLRSQHVFVQLLDRLISCADDFLFVPTRNDAMPSEKREEWAMMKETTNWLNLKPYQKTRQKQWVQHAIIQYNLVDWTSFLKTNIRQLGIQMLDINETTVGATFSRLGLDAETVAGPQGNRDRQAEEKIMETIPVNRYLMVRNIGHRIDVHITATSYYPLLPRGPPLLLSLYLSLI